MRIKSALLLYSLIFGIHAAAFVPRSSCTCGIVRNEAKIRSAGPGGARAVLSGPCRLPSPLHSDVSLPGTTSSTGVNLQQEEFNRAAALITRVSTIMAIDDGNDVLAVKGGVDVSTDNTDLAYDATSTLSSVLLPPVAEDIYNGANDEQLRSSFVAPALDVWIRRLVTREDSFHLHKIFGVLYLASSSVLLGTGVYNNLAGYPEIPTFLEPFMHVFALSGCMVTASSVRLAWNHRRNEIPARNVFLSSAISSLFSVFVGTWASPFAPSFLMNDTVNRCFFAAFAILGVAGVVDIIMTAGTVVEGKRSKYDPEHVTTLQYVSEYINYILPTLWGLPFFIAVGWLFSVEHDRQWYLDLCAVSAPGLMAQSVYVNVASSAANNWGVLAVTLRDKKLIGKNLEMFIISAASMPALLYNAVGLSEFYAAVHSAQI